MRYFKDHHHSGLAASSTVAIGNFDGLHKGHQELLNVARDAAGPHDECAVVTFEPLPRAWFDSVTAPPRLTSPGQKLALLASQNVDLVWMLRFNDALASMSAKHFVERILVNGLHAKEVVVGHDFRFGRGREGDVALLAELGKTFGFELDVVAAVKEQEQRISSTAIRGALAAGDLALAERMLGRCYSACGRVVHGQQLGRQLGYPTANLRPWGGKTAVNGVFAVQARISDGAWMDGVASAGVRPAAGGGLPLLEVHILDWQGELYGQRLETRFIAKLRDEENFASLDALVEQMKTDEVQARRVLASTALPTP